MTGAAREASGASRSPTRVALIGGTSEIGLATVRRLAAEREVTAALVGRDRERLVPAAAALRGVGVTDTPIVIVDDRDLAGCGRAIAEAFAALGGAADVVIVAVGRLGAQAGLDADPSEAAEVMRSTFTVPALLALDSLRSLRAQGAGTLVVLSSVAGARVRATNAVYGAAKAGLDGLAEALGDDVAGTGVRVLVVRPGFVIGRMTTGLPRPPLATTPDAVAAATVRALNRGADTVWVPGSLRWLFAVLRLLPRSIWRRLPL
jgi:decaprenylphospho-beta-D-erythro-pentofuranosid-2-ulose 2-reductase